MWKLTIYLKTPLYLMIYYLYSAGKTWHFQLKFPTPARKGSNSPPTGHKQQSYACGLSREGMLKLQIERHISEWDYTLLSTMVTVVLFDPLKWSNDHKNEIYRSMTAKLLAVARHYILHKYICLQNWHICLSTQWKSKTNILDKNWLSRTTFLNNFL